MQVDRWTDAWFRFGAGILLWVGLLLPGLVQAFPECVADFDPDHDYFPETVQVDYARNFQVSYHRHYKVVTVTGPWSEKGESFKYLLVQCGTPIPSGFENAQMIQVPLKSMVVLSTTYFSFVEQLDLLERLIGIANFKQVNSPKILERIERKQVVEVGRNVDLNLESTLRLNPDIVMTYGTGNPYRDGYTSLLKLGIHVGIFAEYLEPTPLGRAEWIKFMALFFNREAQAKRVFNEIATEYGSMVQLTQNVTKRPSVFTGTSIEGTWYMPGGQSYIAAFLQDAGAEYLWAENSSQTSLHLDLEAVLKTAAHADYWLNTGVWKSLNEGLAEDRRYRFFSAFQHKTVFNNNALLNPYGGNDYWERGVTNPHLVLADLIKIFHPDLLPDHQLIWYRQLQ